MSRRSLFAFAALVSSVFAQDGELLVNGDFGSGKLAPWNQVNAKCMTNVRVAHGTAIWGCDLDPTRGCLWTGLQQTIDVPKHDWKFQIRLVAVHYGASGSPPRIGVQLTSLATKQVVRLVESHRGQTGWLVSLAPGKWSFEVVMESMKGFGSWPEAHVMEASVRPVEPPYAMYRVCPFMAADCNWYGAELRTTLRNPNRALAVVFFSLRRLRTPVRIPGLAGSVWMDPAHGTWLLLPPNASSFHWWPSYLSIPTKGYFQALEYCYGCTPQWIGVGSYEGIRIL